PASRAGPGCRSARGTYRRSGEPSALGRRLHPKAGGGTMSEASSAPSPDEALLLEFQKEYEAAQDKQAVIERYCARRPDLAARRRDLGKRVRARAAMGPMLERSAAGPPERLGEFAVLREIRGGGMGRIYEAKHERLGRRVAVKAIRPDRDSPQARERFEREQ